MAIQLPLPARWAEFESRRDARETLAALRRDVLLAKASLRDVLDELSARHGIPARDIAYAVEGYVDDLLSDAVHNVERGLEREIENSDPA